jgi:hypothetical protein
MLGLPRQWAIRDCKEQADPARGGPVEQGVMLAGHEDRDLERVIDAMCGSSLASVRTTGYGSRGPRRGRGPRPVAAAPALIPKASLVRAPRVREVPLPDPRQRVGRERIQLAVDVCKLAIDKAD